MEDRKGVQFLYFTEFGKMSTSIDHDNLYMHNKIFRETTKNLYKERHSKTLKINQNGFSKSSSDR